MFCSCGSMILDFGGGVWFEVEVETDVFGLFVVEIFVDGGFDFFVEIGDASGAGFGLDERSDVADFGFDADAVAVFLGDVAGEDGSGTLEVAEGVAHWFVAAAQNPVDDFAFAHDVEVVEIEVAAVNHGLHHVAEELAGSAAFVTVIVGGKFKVFGGELSSDRRGLEGDFVEVTFVFGDSEVGIESFNLVESPSSVEEVAVAKSVFETVGGEAGNVVVGEREDMVIGDFAGEDAVLFELLVDGFGIANNLVGVFFDGFLGFGVAVHVVDSVFERGRGNVVEEPGEGLFFVVSEAPNNQGDANAVLEDGAKVGEVVEGAIIHADHADTREALEFGGGDIFEEPGGEFGAEKL